MIQRFGFLILLLTMGFHDGEVIPAKEVTITPVGNEMRYETTKIEAKAGTKLTLIFKNTATTAAMHHNVVVLQQETDIEAVGKAALTTKDNGYIPADYAEDIVAFTEMAAPGETRSITFTVPPPGEYPYICTFPGHYTTMRGTLISVQ